MKTFSKYFPNLTSSINLVPKVFGCVSFVHVHAHNRDKLDARAIKCIFMGYSSTQKGYKCYHSPIRQFYVSSNASFVEHKSYFNHPYLQGETSFMEDMDIGDLFLLDLLPFVSKSSHS